MGIAARHETAERRLCRHVPLETVKKIPDAVPALERLFK
jgi:hypothetical protein